MNNQINPFSSINSFHSFYKINKYKLSKCLENLFYIRYFYKINKLGDIHKNINDFYKSNMHNDLDINGKKLSNTIYPNLWIDAYLDREDGYYNTQISIIFELREKTKIYNLNYSKYTYCEDWYNEWLNRFNLYNENDIDYYNININYSKKIIFRDSKDLNKKEYFIIFNFKGCNLKEIIHLSHKLNHKINIIKKWIYYIMIKKRKEKLLYQFKCLPIYIKNEIETLYEKNNW